MTLEMFIIFTFRSKWMRMDFADMQGDGLKKTRVQPCMMIFLLKFMLYIDDAFHTQGCVVFAVVALHA